MDLLGKICCVSVLVAANLKQTGRLTFQLGGHGAVSMLVVDCTETLNLRGYAKHVAEIAPDSTARGLLGDGQLVMSLETAESRQPYQSFVPIEGETINDIFQHYLAQSEQQPAILILFADKTQASGIFLQKLPGAEIKDVDGWNRISLLAKTIKQQELQELDPVNLLERVFPEETVRVFEPKLVSHDFPPDREKITDMLRAIGEAEVRNLLAEHGEIVVMDDLSNHRYCFSPDEALAIFQHSNLVH